MLVIIVWANWYIAAIIPVVLLIVVPLFRLTIRAYRECTRIESVTKSPLLNLMNESISGGTTIRAFGKQTEFIHTNNQLLDKNILANQILVGCWCWYSVRMDFISIIIMAVATVVVMVFKDSED